MEKQSLFSLPSSLFLSLSPSLNCSTSYLQKVPISQEINTIWCLNSACPLWLGRSSLPHNRSDIGKMLLVSGNVGLSKIYYSKVVAKSVCVRARAHARILEIWGGERSDLLELELQNYSCLCTAGVSAGFWTQTSNKAGLRLNEIGPHKLIYFHVSFPVIELSRKD